VDVTVYDYFMNRWSMKMEKSANLPCLIVGKPKRPTYLPLEVCPSLPVLVSSHSFGAKFLVFLVLISCLQPGLPSCAIAKV
jgi:hypothetical protein